MSRNGNTEQPQESLYWELEKIINQFTPDELEDFMNFALKLYILRNS
jgi:hypothetical protein